MKVHVCHVVYSSIVYVFCKFNKSTHGCTRRGGSPPPPSLLDKQSQSGNIRFTVGQYWLIIKINGTNSVNFVGNSVNFVGNMLSNRNFLVIIPPPPPSTTILENFSGKFVLTTRAHPKKSRKLLSAP